VSTHSASATASVDSRASKVFPRLTQHDPSKFYPKYGVLPAVVAVRDQTGGWDAAGQTRTLVLSDGGTLLETLRSAHAPVFAYDLTHFTGLFGLLVANAHSEWMVVADDDDGERSTITWTYSFTSRPGRGFVIAAIVRLAWAPYMRRVLPPIAAWTVARPEVGSRRTPTR
jgi:hypothetical protein